MLIECLQSIENLCMNVWPLTYSIIIVSESSSNTFLIDLSSDLPYSDRASQRVNIRVNKQPINYERYSNNSECSSDIQLFKESISAINLEGDEPIGPSKIVKVNLFP